MLGGYIKLNLSTKELTNALVELSGKCVQVDITHLLYGPQKIRCNLNLINSKSELGFEIEEHKVYIKKDKIVKCGINKNKYYFEDDVMTITITKI